MQDTIHHTPDSLRRLLAPVLAEAAEGLLPGEAQCTREEFYPLQKIRSRQELLWVLDYAAEQDFPLPQTRQRYLLYLSDYPEFHPVFLIATVYTLLRAGAEIHVRLGEGDRDSLPIRILERLAARNLVLLPGIPETDREVQDYINSQKLTRMVCLGDAANSHSRIRLAQDTCVEKLYYPADHLLISDFARDPEWTEKNRLFDRLCWDCSIDYEGYRAPTNKAEEVYLGFDYGDLFWGADAVVNERNHYTIISDRIPAIFFSDRPKEEVWLPRNIARCCDVHFFQDWDCRTPLYDFSQLV